MNLAMTRPVTKVKGIALIDLVKWSIAVMISLCPLNEVGLITPIK